MAPESNLGPFCASSNPLVVNLLLMIFSLFCMEHSLIDLFDVSRMVNPLTPLLLI